jgi:hypothetical protein
MNRKPQSFCINRAAQADPTKLFIERFRPDRPGREPCLLTPAPADCRKIAQ